MNSVAICFPKCSHHLSSIVSRRRQWVRNNEGVRLRSFLSFRRVFFFSSSSSTSSGPLETSISARLLLTHSSGDCWATQVVTTSTPTHIAGRFLLHPFSPHFFFLFRLLFKKKDSHTDARHERRRHYRPTTPGWLNKRASPYQKKKSLDKNKTRGPLWFSLFCLVVFFYFVFGSAMPNRKVHNEVAESRGRPYPIPATGNVISILG